MVSKAINIAEWSGASAALAIGLTVGQAIAVNAVSTIIICLALVTSGHGGGKWHIPFVRTSFSRTRLHKSLLLGRDQSQCLGHSWILVRIAQSRHSLVLLVRRSSVVWWPDGQNHDWVNLAQLLQHEEYIRTWCRHEDE